jgi:S-adenosylmethionine:tRNA ribosyltransferase-isomerase
LKTSDFDFHLPESLIAQEPSRERGDSRLLVLDRREADGKPADRHFHDLPALIPPGDLLVVNTTRVRHARFIGTRASGAAAEVLLLHPGTGGHWVAMGKPGSALRPGRRITIGPAAFIETVAVLDEGFREVKFVGIEAEAAITRFGRLPLPPYIDRTPTATDQSRYQTVYAARVGSVAAPTAGLHFTPALLDALTGRGVGIARIELEVGPGTFRPVETDNPLEHPMHPEWFEIGTEAASAVNQTHARGNKVWAVGTTVVRSLESAAAADGTVTAGRQETRLLITPGYRFKAVDHLITNFHLPRSTLLMLVSAFGGYDRIMRAYRHAVEQRYRFYSYGDAMLIR